MQLSYGWPRDGMTPHAPAFRRGSRSIVVVEDSEDLAASVAVLLEAEGYVACYALTGAAAMDLVVRSRADAVLLDYMLPDMTGADVAIALRDDPKTRRVHIIMCTGTAEATVRESFTDYHAFLTKPVEPTDLMRSLALAFATH
jgi:CheY-like chemotaxis protein